MKRLFTLMALCMVLKSGAQSTLYYPPVSGNTWDTVSMNALGWCSDKMDSLINFLGQRQTKAFLLLKDGKMVVEHYYGSFTADSAWQWNSAGKSLTAFLVGLMQEQGKLSINDSMPRYLGPGFSSCSASQENAIRLYHQLTMTTGFDDGYAANNACTADTCLVCMAAPGTRWAYHNAPYSLLHNVLDSATRQRVNAITFNNLGTTCGITGS